MAPHPSSIHPYSPNALDNESEYYWLQLAVFFQWPHITYFDDFEDLERKLKAATFKRSTNRWLKRSREERKKRLMNNWCKVFKRIERERRVPQDDDKAVQELYGVSSLKVY